MLTLTDWADIFLNEQLQIIALSEGARSLLPHLSPAHTADIRQFFPELTTLESTLIAIAQGEQSEFVLPEVLHTLPQSDAPQYFTLSFRQHAEPGQLRMRIVDVTETAQLRQSLMQQINETQLALKALQTSEAYNKRIIATMQKSLLITDSHGQIKTVNAAAIAQFGYDRAWFFGRPLVSLFWHPHQLDPAWQEFWQQQTSTLTQDVLCRTGRDRPIMMEFSATIVHSRVEDVPNFVYVGRDITARKALEQEMDRALAREKELSDLKSRFISMTSHEFKNPLSTIILAVELLDELGQDWTTEKRQKYLDRIKSCAIKMNALLEDVLLIGRADVQKLALNPQPLKILPFCERLIEDVRPLATPDHQLRLQSELSRDQVYVLDEKLLGHILENLLSNAIKYSPQGGPIQLTVSAESTQLCFVISDHGIGIPPEDQSRLFEYFHRSRNVSDIAGTGLGLSIVKRAVELQQGAIAFTTQLNQGTTFTVKLPLVTVDAAGAQ
jgi:PAS domain S-box-containing protein